MQNFPHIFCFYIKFTKSSHLFILGSIKPMKLGRDLSKSQNSYVSLSLSLLLEQDSGWYILLSSYLSQKHALVITHCTLDILSIWTNPVHLGQRLFLNPFLSTAAAAAASLQSCLTPCDPIDGSQPGFPSLGFSRQEHWSGLPVPCPLLICHKWHGFYIPTVVWVCLKFSH